jgi:pimeloyl-ACP methyl ester carboxylesterase
MESQVTPSCLPPDAVRLNYRSSFDGFEDWAIVYPRKNNDTWIVCIHGHGSNGDQLYSRPDIRDLWLPKFLSLDCGILTPNLRNNAWMSPAAALDLHDLLTFLRLEFNARQFILASGSMGGTSNLIYSVLYPRDVAAVIALCPATNLTAYHAWCREHNTGVIKEIADAIETAYGGPPSAVPAVYEKHSTLTHCELLTIPVYVNHGSADELIPVTQSRLLADKMAGINTFKYEEIPQGHHDTPLSFLPQALDWVMSRL